MLRLIPHPPYLRGERVILRPPGRHDKSARLVHGKDAEYARMVGDDDATPLTMDDIERWYDWLASQPLGWVIDIDGRAVGEARIHTIAQRDRRGRYAVGIFDPALRGRGLGTEVTQLVLRYAFECVGFHRIDLRVLAYNHRAIAVYEKCGFVREGVERESAWISGEWHSDLMLSILEQEYLSAVTAWPVPPDWQCPE